MTVTWDPGEYLDFQDHRARPFIDLLARVSSTAPRQVVDAGCGPGHLTAALGTRWPHAAIRGFDSSPAMVDKARANGVEAELLDISDWAPGPEDDVVIANAVLHWVPDHQALLARWMECLPSGAWLAIQVPGNFAAPSHTLARELAGEPRWRERITTLRDSEAVGGPADYARTLSTHADWVDIWETTYLHQLEGTDPVLHWIRGTALRPARDALLDTDYDQFEQELAPRLRAAYPRNDDGTTYFPFRRIFAVARHA